MVNALIIARATQGLIAGEAAAPPVLEDIRAALDAFGLPVRAADIRTLQLGPHEILVALPATSLVDGAATEVSRQARDVAARLRSVDHRISHVLFAFDDGGPDTRGN